MMFRLSVSKMESINTLDSQGYSFVQDVQKLFVLYIFFIKGRQVY